MIFPQHSFKRRIVCVLKQDVNNTSLQLKSKSLILPNLIMGNGKFAPAEQYVCSITQSR